MYIISSCLLGINCRYDGKSLAQEGLIQLVKLGRAITVCPEVFGGLPIPRIPCEIVDIKGELKVIDKLGNDKTRAFMDGAEKTLKICQTLGVDTAILKSRSPSCGCGQIYDGSFSGNIVDGNGFTAELLERNNIRVLTEENWHEHIRIK